jgi:hypothetical protein
MSAVPGAILIALGLGITTLGLALKARARRQHDWDRVDGTITSSAAELFGDAYAPTIEYIYSHKGRRIRGTRVRSLEVLFNWRGPSGRTALRFPKGSSVTVYVNPASSYDAVLEPGGDRWAVAVFFIFGCIPIAIGTWIILDGFLPSSRA